MLLNYVSALHLAGEQFMQNPGPTSGMSEQYSRGPPGPMGNMQLGHRQQYGPYGPGYDRRYELLPELLHDTFAMCSRSLALIPTICNINFLILIVNRDIPTIVIIFREEKRELMWPVPPQQERRNYFSEKKKKKNSS